MESASWFNKMIFGKRGLSPVIATLAIIMMTIAAAAFIAGFVVPLIRNSLNEGTECIGYEEYFTFYEGFEYNCFVESSGTYYYAFSVRADTISEDKIENIDHLSVQFLGADNAGVEIRNGSAIVPGEIRMLRTSSTELTLPYRGEVKTYVYESTNQFDRVEIFPVLKGGRVCDMTDSLSVKRVRCSLDIDLFIP